MCEQYFKTRRRGMSNVHHSRSIPFPLGSPCLGSIADSCFPTGRIAVRVSPRISGGCVYLNIFALRKYVPVSVAIRGKGGTAFVGMRPKVLFRPLCSGKVG